MRWWVAFAGAFVAMAAWAMATPLLGGPDEGEHAIRAAAEVRGEMGEVEWIEFGPTAHARAPEAYARADDMLCFSLRPGTTPDCQPSFSGDGDLVEVTTYEFRPPPAYYLAVGWVTHPWPASAGVYAMRLLSAAACAAFVATALAAARRPLARMGVLVAATPMALYLGGQVNPNGLEAAAALCLWSTTQALADDDGTPDRPLVARAGIALAVLAVMRGFSAPVAVLVVLAAAISATPSRRRALARRTDVRAAGAVGLVAVVASLAWSLDVYGDGRVPRDGRGIGDAPGRLVDFLREAVGVFGSLDIDAPFVAYALWAAVTIAVLAAAVRRVDAALGLVAAVAVLVPLAVDSFDVPSIGFDWQGRYSLGLYAGVVVVATARSPRTLHPAAAYVLVAAHVVAFVETARHLAGGSLLDPEWSPAVSVWVLAAALAAGSAALAVTATSEPR
jgi:hypothetical protein